MASIHHSFVRRYGNFTFTLVPETSRVRPLTEELQESLTEVFRVTRKPDGIVPYGGNVGLPELFRTMGDPKVLPSVIEQEAREFIGRETVLIRSYEFASGRYSMNGLLDTQAFLRGQDNGNVFQSSRVAEMLLHFLYTGQKLLSLSSEDSHASVKVTFDHCIGFTLFFTGMYRIPETRSLNMKFRSVPPSFEARLQLNSDKLPESLHGAFDRIMVELFRWFGLGIHTGVVDDFWKPYGR